MGSGTFSKVIKQSPKRNFINTGQPNNENTLKRMKKSSYFGILTGKITEIKT